MLRLGNSISLIYIYVYRGFILCNIEIFLHALANEIFTGQKRIFITFNNFGYVIESLRCTFDTMYHNDRLICVCIQRYVNSGESELK